MTGSSKYNISGGQQGAVGDNAEAHDFNMISPSTPQPIDLQALAHELTALRTAAAAKAEEPADHLAIGAIAAAEAAAKKGDEAGSLQYLKGVGQFALKIAQDIGTKLAAEIIKKQMGI